MGHKVLTFAIFIILIILIISSCLFLHKNYSLNPSQIAYLSSRNCPNANDMNKRFEKLYRKYARGKIVPYKFIDGTEIIWEEIFYNLDYLIKDK